MKLSGALRRAIPTRAWGPLGLLGVAVLLEVTGTWALFLSGEGSSGWPAWLAAHVAGAGLCAEGLRWRTEATGEGSARVYFVTGGVLAGVFPLFGPAAVFLLALLPLEVARARTAEPSLEQKRARAAQQAREQRRRKQQVGSDLDAIVDALKDRDKRVRVAAIEALQGDTSKAAVRLLAASRDNTVFDVRIRAVEGLSRISEQYSEQLAEARAAMERDPKSPERCLALAALCLRYGELNLEDADVVRALNEQALQHAERARSLGGDALATGLAAAWAERALGHHLDSERRLRALAVSVEEPPAEVLLGIAESQYLEKNFAALPDTCRYVLSRVGTRLDPQMAEVLKIWVRSR